MPAIRFRSFAGELPKIDQRLLPDDFAAYALNVSVESGALSGINDPKPVASFGGRVEIVQKAWRLDNNGVDFWFTLSDPDADLVKGPLVNDLYDRYYWTRPDDYPAYNTLARMANGDPPYRLGVTNPSNAPFLEIIAGPGVEEEETRSYIFTFVTEYGEEGAPSPPVTDTAKTDDTWRLSGLNQTPGPEFEVAIPIKRIYRTFTSGAGVTAYYFVADIPFDQATYDDTISNEDIAFNTTLESTDWSPPPLGLQGLVAMPNGFLAGFVKNDIYFSEPYRPHAWPVGYVISTEYDVVGLGVLGTTLAIMTNGKPQAATGTHPSVMTLEKNDTPEPCMSKGSIVNAPEGVYYAGSNGLMLVTAGGPQNVLKDIVSRSTWQQRFMPKDIRAARNRTGYIGLTALGKGFMIELGSTRTAFIEFTNMVGALNIQNDYRTGAVYLIGGQKVFEWDPDAPPRTTGLWRSKEFHFPKPCNLGAFCFKMDLGDVPPPPILPNPLVDNRSAELLTTLDEMVPEGQKVRFRVWADRKLVHDTFVNDNSQQRLPSGFKADVWQFEVITRVTVNSIEVGETPKELQNA